MGLIFVRGKIRRRREKNQLQIVFPLPIPYLFTMINVVVGIILEHDRVLLCQRKREARYGLKWEFPGGKIDGNESEVQCLQRELIEELDIDAQIGQLLYIQEYVYPDSGSYRVFYYKVTSYSGVIANKVFESYRWVLLNDLSSYDILKGNQEVVEKLISLYGQLKITTS